MVEQGPTRQVLNTPQHPYTQALIAAVPVFHPGASRPAVSSQAILTLQHVSKTFRQGSWLARNRRISHALRDINLTLPQGSTLGIVGESGSGKSTLARCIVRLYQPDSGEIILSGQQQNGTNREQQRQQSRKVQIVFQDPFASLNPRQTVGEIVAKGPEIHGETRKNALKKARDLFALVGLDPESNHRYPHEFSGGQRQRIGLARALAMEPRILVADEPVSALDVSVQAQVLNLLAELRQRLGLSLIFITHDLRVAAQICDQIIVMKEGRIVEQGDTHQVFLHPQHNYTRLLLSAIPGKGWNTQTS